MYIVTMGSVGVFSTDEIRDDDAPVATCVAGSYFGDHNILLDHGTHKFDFTYQALSFCDVLVLTIDTLDGVMRTNEHLSVRKHFQYEGGTPQFRGVRCHLMSDISKSSKFLFRLTDPLGPLFRSHLVFFFLLIHSFTNPFSLTTAEGHDC